jgi:hypothetical protein
VKFGFVGMGQIGASTAFAPVARAVFVVLSNASSAQEVAPASK